MGAVHAVRCGITHDDVLIIDDRAAGLRRRLARFDEAWWHVLALRTGADVGWSVGGSGRLALVEECRELGGLIVNAG